MGVVFGGNLSAGCSAPPCPRVRARGAAAAIAATGNTASRGNRDPRRFRPMPVHDWGRVPAGIFHAFHHEWIADISRARMTAFRRRPIMRCPNKWPGGSVCMCSLESGSRKASTWRAGRSGRRAGRLARRPSEDRDIAQAEGDFNRRKQKQIAIRHATETGRSRSSRLFRPATSELRRLARLR